MRLVRSVPGTGRAVRTPHPGGLIRGIVSTALLAGVCLCSAWPAAADPVFLPSQLQGGWTAADKQLHFAGSLAIAASLRVTGRSEAESMAGAAGVGVLKEVYDVVLKPKRYGRGASWRDLVADFLGAAAGVALVGALE